MTDAQLFKALRTASPDERKMVGRFVSKMMGEGVREFGSLDLVKKPKDPAADLVEAQDEITDGVFYLLRRMETLSRVLPVVPPSSDEVRVLRENLSERDALIRRLSKDVT